MEPLVCSTMTGMSSKIPNEIVLWACGHVTRIITSMGWVGYPLPHRRTGVFPDLLKFAKITPLHKKESKLDFHNYRPI